MFQFLNQYIGDLKLFYPELIIFSSILLILLIDLVLKERARYPIIVIGVAGLLFSIITIRYNIGSGIFLFSSSVEFDKLSVFFKFFFGISGILTIMLYLSTTEISTKESGEFFIMLLGSIAGMFVLASANDIIVFYLAFETVSLPSYVLAGLSKDSGRSREAALKYIIFGAVSSGIMLFGISMLCGVTGTTNFQTMNEYISYLPITPGTLLVIVALITAGLAFKISAVPFHMWTPDVYEGSAIPVTAFFSVAPKAAGFIAIIRFFFSIFSPYGVDGGFISSKEWIYLFSTLSIATMTLGNLAAIPQNNIKRLLAYSSISHVGYMLIGIIVATVDSITSILLYLLIYLFMNLGAFYCALLIREKLGVEEIDKYSGLGWRAPFISTSLSIFLISLVGLPPLAGFVGKVIIFSSAIKAGYFTVVFIAVINSVISLYYYAGIIKKLFLEQSENSGLITIGFYPKFLLLIFLAPVIILGLYWNHIYNWILTLVGS